MPKIPLEILFQEPEAHRPKISLDGKLLAYLKPSAAGEELCLIELASKTNFCEPVSLGGKVLDYGWLFDDQGLFLLQDHEGNENFRLYLFDLERNQVEAITPYENVYVKGIRQSPAQPRILLFEMNLEIPSQHDVYSLDISKRTYSLLQKNDGNISDWVFDREFQLKGYVRVLDDGSRELQIRDELTHNFRPLLTWDWQDGFGCRPLRISRDGQSIFLVDYTKTDCLGLVQVDLQSGYRTILASDKRYDLDSCVLDPVEEDYEAALFVAYTGKYVSLKSNKKQDYEKITSSLKGEFRVVSKNQSNDVWVIKEIDVTGLISYYLYQGGELSFLFTEHPKLENLALNKYEPFQFSASDGLNLEGYIMYPKEKTGGPLPLVLSVHGGPWWRDYPEYFAREAQWITNRGYIFMAVNFRGSTGYGKQFTNLGNKEWGRRMHQDLIDAVNWAVQEGIAQKERVAIFGHSYGGYAALAGVTFSPEVFCCAVDRVGPSNLISLMLSLPPYWQVMRSFYINRVGDPESEQELLKAASPFFHLENIQVPVLIAQGKNDPRVLLSESENVVNFLKEQNKPHEYILFDDEGHVFTKEENILRFFKVAEEFFAKHL